MVLLLVGITAGVALIQGPIDLRNRAAEPNKCEGAIATCTVGDITDQDFDTFKIQIIDPITGEVKQEGAIGSPNPVTAVVEPGKKYICRVIGVTAGGTKRTDCPTNDDEKTTPICSGPSPTPTTPLTNTPVPSNPPSPTPTGPVVSGCPINIRNVEPILCVVDAEGRCLVGDTITLTCAEVRKWKTALSSADIRLIEGFSLIYRLAVYDQNGGILATTRLNDTRDGQPDQTELQFPAQTGLIYTSRLEVFDETRLNPTICNHISGRLRCAGITPPMRIPTTVVPTSSLTACSQSSGDLNLDGNVDTRDVNMFVRSQFTRHNLSASDINCDDKVDSADWALLFTRVFGQ